MTQHRWDADQHLLDDLGGAVREATPLAGALAEVGIGVCSGRSDSDQTRVLVFMAPPLALELEVMGDHAVGQIVPPGPGKIWVETTDLATSGAEADSTGFFILPDKLHGPVRLRCDTPAGQLVTNWVRL